MRVAISYMFQIFNYLLGLLYLKGKKKWAKSLLIILSNGYLYTPLISEMYYKEQFDRETTTNNVNIGISINIQDSPR